MSWLIQQINELKLYLFRHHCRSKLTALSAEPFRAQLLKQVITLLAAQFIVKIVSVFQGQIHQVLLVHQFPGHLISGAPCNRVGKHGLHPSEGDRAVLECHLEEGQLDAEEDSSQEARCQQASSHSQADISSLAPNDLAVSCCHLLAVPQAPPYKLVGESPFVLPHLTSSHGFELVRKVEVAAGRAISVVHKEGVLGVPISNEVEGFLLQANKHPNYYYLNNPNLNTTSAHHNNHYSSLIMPHDILLPAATVPLFQALIIMISECIDQIQISISERFDHLTTLLLDGEQLSTIVRDEERKRMLVKNFRTIKASEKARVIAEDRCLKQLERWRQLTKPEVIACETMLANCINQYLNTDYEARKTGDMLDLIDIFLFYYRQVAAHARVSQLTVIRNCNLATEFAFLQDNLAFFLSNVRASMNRVYEREKERFLSVTKCEVKWVSPEKREDEGEEGERFDATGRRGGARDKKRLQQYCFELSKLLDLESIYVNYFYFNSLDAEKRKKALASNYTKRNVHIRRMITSFEVQHRAYRQRNRMK